ncbi:hypothetical protein ACIGNX_22320 [Actinosynnema sp. NPDC053489]|uniref:hypothetical protein n=1 Tax=Actinosynnema sp. NPDC053489 TaxID=3363916 RepID=UPI0037C6A66F
MSLEFDPSGAGNAWAVVLAGQKLPEVSVAAARALADQWEALGTWLSAAADDVGRLPAGLGGGAAAEGVARLLGASRGALESLSAWTAVPRDALRELALGVEAVEYGIAVQVGLLVKWAVGLLLSPVTRLFAIGVLVRARAWVARLLGHLHWSTAVLAHAAREAQRGFQQAMLPYLAQLAQGKRGDVAWSDVATSAVAGAAAGGLVGGAHLAGRRWTPGVADAPWFDGVSEGAAEGLVGLGAAVALGQGLGDVWTGVVNGVATGAGQGAVERRFGGVDFSGVQFGGVDLGGTDLDGADPATADSGGGVGGAVPEAAGEGRAAGGSAGRDRGADAVTGTPEPAPAPDHRNTERDGDLPRGERVPDAHPRPDDVPGPQARPGTSTRPVADDAADRAPRRPPAPGDVPLGRLWAGWLTDSVVPEDERDDDLVDVFGPDLFGLRAPAPTPPFLLGLDHDALTTGQLVSLLHAMDLTRTDPVPPLTARDLPDAADRVLTSDRRGTDLTAWAPRGREAPLPPVLHLPKLMHSIWLGGPLTDQGGHAAFRERVAARAGDWTQVLWTDVPRADFARADTTPPPAAGAPDPSADVRSLREWALDHRVVLVNVDEYFHEENPLVRHPEFAAERAKLVPSGYAAASDILRWEVVHHMGGAYLDGDNAVTDTSALEAVITTPQAYAVHVPPRATIGNSVVVAPREHPVAAVQLLVLERKYTLAQRQVVPPDLLTKAPDAFRDPRTDVRRNSVVHRTGPGTLHDLAAQLRTRYQDLPRVESGVTVNSDMSWVDTPVARPGRDLDDAEVLATLQRVVHTLVRDLVNREGDLHLTAVAALVDRLPSPEDGWDAVLSFLASRPDLARQVTSVTHRRTGPRGDVEVELPDDAYEYLHPGWELRPVLGEERVAARLSPPGPRAASWRSPVPRAPAGTPGPAHGVPTDRAPDSPATPFGLTRDAWESARAAVPAVRREHSWADPRPRLVDLAHRTRDDREHRARFDVAAGADADPLLRHRFGRALRAADGLAGPTVVSGSFDVRRVERAGERVTELTVRIAFAPHGTTTDRDVADTWSALERGVREVYNAPGHVFRTGPVGDRLLVRVERAPSAEPAHWEVVLTDDPSVASSDQRRWRVGRPALEYAHELGHQLGLRDEHGARPEDLDRPEPDRDLAPPRVLGSLMGDFHRPPLHDLPPGGLRDRHLDLLGTLVGDVAPHRLPDRAEGG